MKAIIVAYDRNHVIGNHGDIPWQGKMRRDAHFFRDMTKGRPVIMGSKTYEAMGRLLPHRQNIIITRDELQVDGATVVHTLEDAYKAVKDNELVFVMGGGQIYTLAMDSVDIIYATEIDAYTTGDAHFPEVDLTKWRETKREHHVKDDLNMYDYDFVTYERNV